MYFIVSPSFGVELSTAIVVTNAAWFTVIACVKTSPVVVASVSVKLAAIVLDIVFPA